MNRLRFAVFLGAASLAACRTVPPRPSLSAPVTTSPLAKIDRLRRLGPAEVPAFVDDSDPSALRAAIRASAEYYRSLPPGQFFQLDQDRYTAREIAESFEELAQEIASAKSSDDWLKRIRDGYAIYQSVGTDANRAVTFSSYYEPTIPGRLKPDKRFRYPLYGRPQDLVDVDLGLFDPVWQGARVAGRRQGRGMVPYYTREEIDSARRLEGQGLEIAWAENPLDVFFLQIEGSGWLDLGGGNSVRIRYDGDNGKKYKSVGQYLISTKRIPAKGFDHFAFQRYMDQHPKERQSLLNVDERYIFFRLDISTAASFAYGNINEPLTGGRSIATDPKLFPKGMLAWIDVDGGKARRMQRFVLNQDEGGAIQGPGRVDFFAGHGPEAEKLAMHFWNPGKLYFLVKKNR